LVVGLKRLRLWDLASLPYRVRLGLGRPLGAAREFDAAAPFRPIRAALVGAAVTVVSFVPTAAAMLVPVFLAVLLGNGFADLRIERSGLLTATLAAFVIFTIYLLLCAAFVLLSCWRSALRALASSDQTRP
jgi:hypothetical protein